MKNTLENKVKFFAQYWYQFVGFRRFHVGRDEGRLVSVKCENLHEIDYLELKPLSSISNEDLSIVDFPKRLFKMIIVDENQHETLRPSYVDYLRSKGYSLPWNEISVEEQIQYGWIKLKE